MINVLKKDDGQFSASIILNVLAAVAGIAGLLFPVWESYLPANAAPVVVAVIASLNILVRFFSTGGSPIQGSLAAKDKLGV